MSHPPATDAMTVRELQALAAQAGTAAPSAPARLRPSRASSLHLIDLLSRWGGSGLAVLAGSTIFIAVTIARDTPLRAGVWALMMIAALYFSRRYRNEFRNGDKLASRPFRWRAYYTSSLAVVSAAFGAGAFLLAVPAATTALSVEILAILAAGALTGAALHSAYRASALAVALPAVAFIAIAALRIAGLSATSLIIIAVLAISVAALMIGSTRIARTAERRFPRTALVRREVERTGSASPAYGAITGKAAAKA
ncbi:MAG: hypothetical protein ACKVS5_14095 [Parvularculaceae bacterium]